ncbi:unnamed protein product [Effrenium voratum]|uniref:Uncharacterized protein n=1 Tax=Effrenium voratum TaxID=2562239 RepID=A0AA36J4W3_9DINO|nr:unnamed protein product [Effrenium voratum]
MLAVHLLELFVSDEDDQAPEPLDTLQEPAEQCEQRLDDLRTKSVLAPLETAAELWLTI